jgi:drug/metabolite transporter (DMT)-like permease
LNGEGMSKTAISLVAVTVLIVLAGGIGYLFFGWRVSVRDLILGVLIVSTQALWNYAQEKHERTRERLDSIEQRVRSLERISRD